jgi:arylsulfatase A-like enzyme/tetratricopeptide (TPR) repeat protein
VSWRFILLAAAITAIGPSCGHPAREKDRPDILLVTIDTFRADRLGAGITPTIDRLASSGIRFISARSAVPLTLPSHTTILTGLLPLAHGVRENGVDHLDERHSTVTRLLRAAGYDTAAFVGAFVLDRRFGLAQGFDLYDDQIPRDPSATDRLEAERPAVAVVDRALAWLEGRTHAAAQPVAAARPYFLWIHLYDPHAPYTPPQEFRKRTKSAYDGEVMYADAQLGRVVDWIEAHRRGDGPLIVIAGDHGEGLGEHGERTHGMLLYDSTLRVPLVVVQPGGAKGGARRDEPVSLVDIAPTILQAASVASATEMSGHDLLSANRTGANRDVYAETEYPRSAGWSPLQALTDGRWKTIRGGSTSEVYDLAHDPAEAQDVSAAHPDVVRTLTTRMERIRRTDSPSGSAAVVSDETAKRLRSLGYVASASTAKVASNAPHPRITIGAWNEFEDALAMFARSPKDAVPVLERLSTAHPESAVFQSMYARALKSIGRTREALDAYRRAAERWPEDATLLHELAVALRDAGKGSTGSDGRALHDEAMRAEEAALARSPESAAAHNGLGLLAIDAERPPDAVREFERATALDSTNASYWTNLGNARRATGDRSGAEQAYKRAVDLDASTVDALNGLGVLLVEGNRAPEAVSWFERAVAAQPDFVEARLNLGIALQNAGDRSRALAAYRAVLKSPGDHHREKDAAATLLASLSRR